MSTTETPLAPLTLDSLIVDAEERIAWDALQNFLRDKGIKCFGCSAAVIETFSAGACIHGFDAAALVQELNALALEHPFTMESVARADQPGFFATYWRRLRGKG